MQISVLHREKQRENSQGQGPDLSNIYVFSIFQTCSSCPVNSGWFVGSMSPNKCAKVAQVSIVSHGVMW